MNAAIRLRRGVRYLGYALGGVAIVLVTLSYREGVAQSAYVDTAEPAAVTNEAQVGAATANTLSVQEPGALEGASKQMKTEGVNGRFDGSAEGIFSGATIYIVPGTPDDKLERVEVKQDGAIREEARGLFSPEPLGDVGEDVPDEIARILDAHAPGGESGTPSTMPEPIKRPQSAEAAAQRENRAVGQSPAFINAFQALINAPELESLLTSGFTVGTREGSTTTLTHPSGVVAYLERTQNNHEIALKATGRSEQRDAIKLEVERALRSFAGEPELYRGENTWFFGEAVVASISNEGAYTVSFSLNELANIPIGVTSKSSESE